VECELNRSCSQKYSDIEGVVVLSWKHKHGGQAKRFFVSFHFLHPFLSVTNTRLSILAGKALTAVTQSGELCEDNAKDVRKITDRIFVI